MFLNSSYRSSFLLRRCFFRNSVPLRSYFFLSVLRRKPFTVKKDDYKTIYEFPHIKYAVGFIRSGVTTIILCLIVTPFVYYYYYESLKHCVFLLASVCIHFTFVLGVAKISKNLVGKIYVKKTGEITEVLFSSLDEFGRRIDRIHNVDDLINCEFYSKISRHTGFIQISAKDLNYKVNIRNCKISDPSIWNYLFGPVAFPEKVEKIIDKKEEIKKIE